MDADQHPTPKPLAGGDAQWLLEIAAGRPIDDARAISDSDLELAVRHGLIGVMADSANDNVSQAVLPIFARLKARQNVMEHHLERILTSLHQADIPATILKGPHLAQWAYRNPDHRTYTDIDLLVPARARQSALSRYWQQTRLSPQFPPKRPKPTSGTYPCPTRPGSASISICTGISSATPSCEDVPTGLPNGHGITLVWFPIIQLGPLWELPEEARIAFLGTHAVLDHRFRMILFRDLAEVALKEPDWDAIRAFAERWKLRSTTYVSLLIAKLATDAPIDDAFLQSLRPRSTPIRVVESVSCPRPTSCTSTVTGSTPSIWPWCCSTTIEQPGCACWLKRPSPSRPGWRRVASPTRTPLPTGPESPPCRIRSGLTRTTDPLTLHVLPVDLARGAQTYAEALSRTLDGDLGSHRTMRSFVPTR